MQTKERSEKLLAVLRKRTQTPAIIARIARVEQELANMKNIPVETPKVEKEKKKVKKTVEIEVDA